MSGIKFMGQQEDPELAVIEARGNVRIYDGTKRSILDDIRALLTRLDFADYDGVTADDIDAARALLRRIDGGER